MLLIIGLPGKEDWSLCRVDLWSFYESLRLRLLAVVERVFVHSSGKRYIQKSCKFEKNTYFK